MILKRENCQSISKSFRVWKERREKKRKIFSISKTLKISARMNKKWVLRDLPTIWNNLAQSYYQSNSTMSSKELLSLLHRSPARRSTISNVFRLRNQALSLSKFLTSALTSVLWKILLSGQGDLLSIKGAGNWSRNPILPSIRDILRNWRRKPGLFSWPEPKP